MVCSIDGESLAARPVQTPAPGAQVAGDRTPKCLRFLCRPVGVLIPIAAFMSLGCLIFMVSQWPPKK